MRFSAATIVAFTALVAAAPVKRGLKARQAGPVLADTTFDEISISGGTAGNAEAEALAVFSALDLENPENIDPADIDFLGAVNDVANDAETDAFNPAIEAATGDEATALENGKTKNKVLKLMATKIELEAKAAQGEDVAAKQEEELTKLNNNIAADQEAAGQPSTAVSFDATISGGGAGAGAGTANANVDANADDANADVAGANGNANNAVANDDNTDATADVAGNGNANANGNTTADDDDDEAVDDEADTSDDADVAQDDEASSNNNDSNDDADDEDDN